MKTLLCLILSSLLFSSCYKDYSVEGRPQTTIQTLVDTTLTDASYFFDAVVNGQREFYIAGKTGSGGDAGSNGFNGSATYYMFVSGMDRVGQKLLPVLQMYRGDIYWFAIDSTYALRQQRVLAGMAPGEYPYTSQPATLSGVWFQWIDRQNKEWRSNWGSGDQNGSHFNITNTTPIYRPAMPNLLSAIRFDCVFNCTLYDGNGNSIKLENGRLKYAFFP